MADERDRARGWICDQELVQMLRDHPVKDEVATELPTESRDNAGQPADPPPPDGFMHVADAIAWIVEREAPEPSRFQPLMYDHPRSVEMRIRRHFQSARAWRRAADSLCAAIDRGDLPIWRRSGGG